MDQPKIKPVEKDENYFLTELEYFLRKNNFLVNILLSLLTIYLIIYFIKTFNNFLHKRNKILLVGLSDSGKTLIFSKLLKNKYVDTLTSMKVNQCIIKIIKKKYNLVDIPGFHRLRENLFDKNKDNTRAVIFVVDSSTFSSDSKEVADFLFKIISDEYINRYSIPILIACNKQDLPLAKTLAVIKEHLEKEINEVHKEKIAELVLNNEDNNKINYLNKIFSSKDKKSSFKFSKIKNKINFINCSAKGDHSNNLNELYIWFETHV